MKRLAAALAVALVSLAAATASAQPHITETNWRQTSRGGAHDRYQTSQGFAAELRFGLYYPNVDDEFGGAAAPYHEVFGDASRFYFGVELDWLPLRIPFVGVLGPGFGWGYTHASATAKITGTNTDSGDKTAFTVMPMHLSAVLRADELFRRTGVPLVPFAKVGPGMGLWYSSAGGETTRVEGALGRGTTFGWHLALGGALALDFLDRGATATLDETTGVNHAYLFGEWMNARLDGTSSSQMHVGSSTWVAGLAVDM